MTKRSSSGPRGDYANAPSRSHPLVAAQLDPDESLDAAVSNAEYARAVGDRVAELVEQALAERPHVIGADPDLMAEAITDLVVDRVADPDHSELADLVAPLWTAEHTRRVLNLSRPSMLERRRTGSLLALPTTEGDFFYPVAQFEKTEGKVRVKPALRRFMMVLRDLDPWTVGVLMHTPAPELGNLTPLDWVRQTGDPEVLVAYAGVVNAELAR